MSNIQKTITERYEIDIDLDKKTIRVYDRIFCDNYRGSYEPSKTKPGHFTTIANNGLDLAMISKFIKLIDAAEAANEEA